MFIANDVIEFPWNDPERPVDLTVKVEYELDGSTAVIEAITTDPPTTLGNHELDDIAAHACDLLSN